MTNFLDRAVMGLNQKKTRGRMKKSLEELTSTQWLSRDELVALQHSRLQRLLEYAYQYVPYYQRIFDEVGFRPSDFRNDFSSLTKIPILTKSIIRENWNDLLTTEPDRRGRMRQHSTSGSMGQPLIFMQDDDFETGDLERHLGWSGWKPGDWQAWIWGWKETTNPGMTQKIQSWLENWVKKRFMINAYTMTDQTMTAFAQRIRYHKPSIFIRIR
jgi:phenylacetate-CoA ligase